MQRTEDAVLNHISHSCRQLARILEAKRHVATQMANNVHAIPDRNPQFDTIPELLYHSQLIGKSIGGYLHSLADLEENIADHISIVFKELDVPEEE